jgi:hypothetical protein
MKLVGAVCGGVVEHDALLGMIQAGGQLRHAQQRRPCRVVGLQEQSRVGQLPSERE